MKEEVDKVAFGHRVAARRQELGFSQDALAGMIGMKQQGIDNIEQGIVARPRKLMELADQLQTTQEWLLWERGPKHVETQEAPRTLTSVPILSLVSAGRLAQAEEPIPVADVPRILFSDLGRGDFFGLRVEGDSMDRVSPEGSIIVVNRADKTLVSGKPYIFAVRGTATFKLWHSERQEQPAYLEPFSTNPKNAPIFFKKRDLVVIGRVRRTVLDL